MSLWQRKRRITIWGAASLPATPDPRAWVRAVKWGRADTDSISSRVERIATAGVNVSYDCRVTFASSVAVPTHVLGGLLRWDRRGSVAAAVLTAVSWSIPGRSTRLALSRRERSSCTEDAAAYTGESFGTRTEDERRGSGVGARACGWRLIHGEEVGACNQTPVSYIASGDICKVILRNMEISSDSLTVTSEASAGGRGSDTLMEFLDEMASMMDSCSSTVPSTASLWSAPVVGTPVWNGCLR